MKLSSKTLQNLLYFWNTKTYVVFCGFSFRASTLFFSLMYGCLCQHRRPGHSSGKKKLHEMKNEKNYMGFPFSYSKNIANFEAFC